MKKLIIKKELNYKFLKIINKIKLYYYYYIKKKQNKNINF